MPQPERLERGGPCWLLKLRQMETQRGQMTGVTFFVGLLGLSCRYKWFLLCLAALVGLVQNIFFLMVYYFDSSVLLSTWKAGQAAVLGRLSFSVCVSGLNFVEHDYLIQPPTSYGYYRVNEVKSAQRKGGSCFFFFISPLSKGRKKFDTW